MIHYRPAQPSDAEAIALLHARSWRENYRGSYPDAFLDGDLPAERRRVWRTRLDRPAKNQHVELAVAGPDLAGFVCVYGAHDPEWGSLVDNLHVARAYQRRGIGTALLERAGAWLQVDHAAQPVHLLVLEANLAARRFYERLGASDQGAAPRDSPGGPVASCLYVWSSPLLLAGASERAARPRS